MHQIYLGCSLKLSAKEVLGYFDIDYDDPDLRSRFDRVFGSGYIEPGSFEVYEASHFPGKEFNHDLIKKMMPFEPDPDILSLIDVSVVKSVFYIESEGVRCTEDENIRLFGPFKIERFDYEENHR
jgi:hypothetical protein